MANSRKLLFVSLIVLNTSFALGQNQVKYNFKLTEPQAEQKAIDYLKLIGQPPSTIQLSHLNIEKPEPVATLSTMQHNSGQWHITVPDPNHTQELDVADDTGAIMSYMKHNDTANRQNALLNDSAPETTISKAKAIALATSALVKAGVMKSGELTLKEAFQDSTSVDDKFWFVSWSRIFHGIIYREQDANVTVDANTGEVTGFSVNFHTPPPTSVVFNVSREQAMSIATQAFSAMGRTFSQAPSIKTEVVQPNDYWPTGIGTGVQQPYARVAWVCSFREDRRNYEAWVDTETGQLLGGDYSGPRGKPNLSIRKPLSKH